MFDTEPFMKWTQTSISLTNYQMGQLDCEPKQTSVKQKLTKITENSGLWHVLITTTLRLWLVWVHVKPLSIADWDAVAQWWEHSLPTNVALSHIPTSTPYVGWVCCWFSPWLWEVFSRVLLFSPLLKNQHFQITIRPEIRYTKNHYVVVLPPNHYLFIYWHTGVRYFPRSTTTV